MGVMKGPKLHRKTRYTRTGTLRKSATATTGPDDVILSGAKDLLLVGRSRVGSMGAPFKPSFGLSGVVRKNLVKAPCAKEIPDEIRLIVSFAPENPKPQ